MIDRAGMVSRFGPVKSRPMDFVVDPAGNIFATDRWDRVIKVTAAGEMTIFPRHMDVAPDGSLYFPDVNNNLDGQPAAIRVLSFEPGP